MISRNVCLALCLFCVPGIYADAINLGAAAAFGVLAGSAVTNTGNSVVTGDVGVSTGTSITGFPPGTINGTLDSNDPLAMQAQADLTTAYNLAAGEPCPAGNVLTGQNLGGLTLTPGVYCFASSAQLTGTLTLNGAGNPNALFVLQMGSTLTTATGASVLLEGSAQSADVFWQVGSSATLGTNTQFEGNILALTSITLGTGANIDSGRALARNGAVTLITNNIDSFDTPEPASGLLLALPLFGLIVYRRQLRIQLFKPARHYPRTAQRASSDSLGGLPCSRIPIREIRAAIQEIETSPAVIPASPTQGCHAGTPPGIACRMSIITGVNGGKNDIAVANPPFGFCITGAISINGIIMGANITIPRLCASCGLPQAAPRAAAIAQSMVISATM